MKKISILLSLSIGVAILVFSGFQDKQPKPWPVPDEYKNMKNPTPDNQETVDQGKALYMRNCASCHGRTGLGDGAKARTLDTHAGDFSKSYFQDQTDGGLFYKTKEGREDMPSYEGKLSDEDIWSIIRYTRTFAK